MAHSWTASNTRSSSRRKMASSFQEEALHEALFSLRKLLAGYVSAMTRACQQIDPLLVDYGNLASVKSLQASLDKTWNNYRESIARYRSLVDENSMEIHEVNNQYASVIEFLINNSYVLYANYFYLSIFLLCRLLRNFYC